MNLARQSTLHVLRWLEQVLALRIHCTGIENLPDAPCLFVCNHFTRLETVLLPYALSKIEGQQNCSSLADGSLFEGPLGPYLSAVGVLSTTDPQRNERIIRDLLTGSCNWIIYPEGSMVKSRKVFSQGQFAIDLPQRRGAPHTGAAVLALQSTLIKEEYRLAHKNNNQKYLNEIQERYQLSNPDELSNTPLHIVPVTISYYPLRPGDNAFLQLAKIFRDGIPELFEEELITEGSLLSNHTDVTIHFSKALNIEKSTARWNAIGKKIMPFLTRETRHNILIDKRRHGLMRKFMSRIYQNYALNFDHLFASALRYLNKSPIHEDQFCRAIYLTAAELKRRKFTQFHSSINSDLSGLLLSPDFPQLVSIRNCALTCNNLDTKAYNQENLYQARSNGHTQNFSNINYRKDQPLSVIANEIEAIPQVIECTKRWINAAPQTLRRCAASQILHDDIQRYQHDLDRTQSTAAQAPYHLHQTGLNRAIVLSHGYLSGPNECKKLATNLHQNGWNVYVVRLAGHATSPEDLAQQTWKNWSNSYQQGLATLCQENDYILCGGFSMGGLLALQCALEYPNLINGIFTINSPIRLADPRHKLVPAILWWNSIARHINENATLNFIENTPEFPDTNYTKNPLRGVQQLEKLIIEVEKRLPELQCPARIFQSPQDPVVDARSAHLIHSQLGCPASQKHIHSLPCSRHVAIRGPEAAVVFKTINTALESQFSEAK